MRKKFNIIFGLLLSFCMVLPYSSSIMAEELNTEINVVVKEGEEGPELPPGGGGGGGTNPETPEGKLAFWNNPLKMEFGGKANAVIDYSLPLTNTTESENRHLGVYDIRVNEHGWTVKGELGTLTSASGTKEINKGYSVSFDGELVKYKSDDEGNPTAETEAVDENAVNVVADVADNRVRIDVGNNKPIIKANINNDDISSTKGFFELIMKDITFDVKASQGIETGEWSTDLTWTLSNTAE